MKNWLLVWENHPSDVSSVETGNSAEAHWCQGLGSCFRGACVLPKENRTVCKENRGKGIRWAGDGSQQGLGPTSLLALFYRSQVQGL